MILYDVYIYIYIYVYTHILEQILYYQYHILSSDRHLQARAASLQYVQLAPREPGGTNDRKE